MKDRPIKHMIGPDSTLQMCDWSSGKSIIHDITVLQKKRPNHTYNGLIVRARKKHAPEPAHFHRTMLE